MKKHFLRYQVELQGTTEDDLTEELVARLNSDFEKRIGIYNELFGEVCEIAAHAEKNTIVLCGCILKDSAKECKATFTMLKSEAKRTFRNCNKMVDLVVATGNKII